MADTATYLRSIEQTLSAYGLPGLLDEPAMVEGRQTTAREMVVHLDPRQAEWVSTNLAQFLGRHGVTENSLRITRYLLGPSLVFVLSRTATPESPAIEPEAAAWNVVDPAQGRSYYVRLGTYAGCSCMGDFRDSMFPMVQQYGACQHYLAAELARAAA